MSGVLFSIIIPTFNRAKSLKRTLKSIFSQNIYPAFGFEVIVVDDGSNDNTKEVASKFVTNYGGCVKYFYHKNKGPAPARNLGLGEAKGKFAVFTDDDVVVDKNWLNNIKSAFDETNVEAIGGSVINPYSTNLSWAHYFLHFSKWSHNRNSAFIDNIPTINVAYNLSFIRKHKLKFDSRSAKFGHEDSLFNYNLIKSGGRIYFNSKVIVKHYCWDDLGYARMFEIQQRTARGFFNDGYKVHGFIGIILRFFPLFNFFLPTLIYSFYRSKGFVFRFIKAIPMIIFFELYRAYFLNKIYFSNLFSKLK